MPRPLRFDLIGVPLHIVQRGNNHAPCFFAEGDRYDYLDWLCDAAEHHGVAIHAYALMANHVHLLATPARSHGVSAMMQTLGRRYVRHVNQKHSRSGTLWEGRFKACLVDSERYVLAAYRYIDLNPVRAGIVTEPAAYRWSSYCANAGMGPQPWLQPHDTYLALGSTAIARAHAYRALCAEVVALSDVDALRAATASGMVYGSEHFKDRVALIAGRPARPCPRGFPAKP
jgi:putative transposase